MVITVFHYRYMNHLRDMNHIFISCQNLDQRQTLIFYSLLAEVSALYSLVATMEPSPTHPKPETMFSLEKSPDTQDIEEGTVHQ